MAARIAEKFSSLAARELTHPIILEYYEGLISGKYPNPVRAMEDCAKDMIKALAKFPKIFHPLVATIGDVDYLGNNRKVSKKEKKEIIKQAEVTGEELSIRFPNGKDRFEDEFADLANEMALFTGETYKGENSNFTKVMEEYQRIFNQNVRNGKNLFRYETSGRGSDESKNLFANQAISIGLDSIDGNDVWLTDGGMGALNRLGISFNSFFRNTRGRKALILAPVPCFTMTMNAQRELGLYTSYLSTEDLPNQELTGARLERYYEEAEMYSKDDFNKNYIPDILYLTPADNPTSRSVDPDKLRSVIQVALKHNPQTIFYFDMAYIKLISEKKAKDIIQVIKDEGAIEHSVFAFSDAKRTGQPASRFGAIIVPKETKLYGKQIGGKDGRLQETTRMINPGFSIETDVMYQAMNNVINRETKNHPEIVTNKFRKLLKQRQQALLEVLQDLDPNGELFKNLDRIFVPKNDIDIPPNNAIVQDVPLYLWLEVNHDPDKKEFLKKCFEIIEKLNIVGVPGTVFKDGNHMRFSLGVVSTLDILKKSQNVMNRWVKKLNN